jgi:ParB-like chromosome segregation protein Spo0J
MRKRTGIFSISTDQIDLRLLALRTPTSSAVKRMAESIQNRGQLTPIIIANDEGFNVLVDGFKRYEAVRTIGHDSLKATSLTADPTQAKAMMYLMNRSGGFSMIEEAMLVRELIETDGLTQTETARLLDHHKSWVSRRLLMIRNLRPEIIDDLKLELIPPGAGPTLARVPQCNQADFSTTIQMHRLSPKEIRKLTDLWCKAGDPVKKQFLIKSPHEALSIIKQEQAGLTTPQKALLRMWKLIAVFEEQLEGKTDAGLKESLYQVKSGLVAMQQYLSACAVCEDRSKEGL